MRLPREDLWNSVLSNEVNPWNIHRRPTRIWECFINRNTASLDKKGQRLAKMKKSTQTIKILWEWDRLITLHSLKYVLRFVQKEGWLRGQRRGPQTSLQQQITFRPWKPIWVLQVDFEIVWDQSLSSSFQIFLGMECLYLLSYASPIIVLRTR